MKQIILSILVLLLLISCKSDSERVNVKLELKTFTFQGEIPIETTSFYEKNSIHFLLTLENLESSTANLEFGSSQHFEYEIFNSEGESVWYWSKGKAFTQATTELIVYGNEEISLNDATWNAKISEDEYLPIGDYIVKAWLLNGKGNLVEFEIKIIPIPSS